ncbi:MAG: T9SS type A sorting domain-containing protein [Bacteroidota bacterium]
MRVFSTLLIICCFFFLRANAQKNTQLTQRNKLGYITPNGLLDTVFDRFGNKMSLASIAIDSKIRAMADSNTDNLAAKTTNSTPFSCGSGYFQLWLDVNCGLDGSSSAAIARRNVFCQVLNDLSAFIPSPLTTSGNKVNIWVRNLSTIPGVPYNALGLATSFYNLPYAPALSGIVDNTVWTTIHTGKDAFTNVVAPLTSSGWYPMGVADFFHGYVAFNFGAVNWHTDMTTAPATGEFDLYTVVLHEMVHALGFASLIDSSGHSKLGANFQYYSRYDQFLKTQSGANLLTHTGSCSMYSFAFNAALIPSAVLVPHPTICVQDSTDAAVAIKYNNGTINQDVYTSDCWQPGSSLSHFEDEWQVPASFTSATTLVPPFTNNQYFTMSNATIPGPVSATSPGPMKRALSPEERLALCDIGYSVATSFGNSTNLNSFTYTGSVCAGLNVAGVNDGILNGSFTNISYNGGWVWVHDILHNDNNADSFSCLEIVQGAGVISALTDTSFYFQPSALGINLLRYIPINKTTGVNGNITYIYIVNRPPNCSLLNPCTMLPNGGFESATDCGDLSHQFTTPPNLPHVDCWDPAIGSPDLYTRNCALAINQGAGDCNIPTGSTTPPTDAHNGAINNHFFGFFSSLELGYYLDEAIQTQMSTSLIPGHKYKMGCWAKINDGLGYAASDNAIAFSVTAAPIALVFNTFSAPGTLLDSFNITLGTIVNDWHYSSKTFVYNGPVGLTNLVVGGAPYLFNNGQAPHAGYIFVDDVDISPIENVDSLSLPDSLTTCQTIPDLSGYVSPTLVSGSSFSGMGVVNNAGIFSFNALTAALANGGPGLITITYSHPDAAGCIHNTYGQIQVNNLDTGFHAYASPDTICIGSNATVHLQAIGAPNYTWSPATGMTCPSCDTTSVIPTASTSYLVESNDTGNCHSVTSVKVYAFPDTVGLTMLYASPNPTSPGATVTASVNYATTAYSCTYVWMNHGIPFDTTSWNFVTYIKGPGNDTISVRAICYLTGCTDTANTSVFVVTDSSHTSSIFNNFENNTIRIYPNPANNLLHIDQLPSTAYYFLLDLVGSVIQQGALHQGDNTIATDVLSSGLYILEIVGAKGQKNMTKIMKR